MSFHLENEMCKSEKKQVETCPNCANAKVHAVPYCTCEVWECTECKTEGCQPFRWTTGEQCVDCGRRDKMKKLDLR